MSTIILLDTSISMMKFIQPNSLDKLTKRDVSHMMIRDLVEIIKRVDKYEKLALIGFSSQAELLCEFTLDSKRIIASLDSIKIGSQTNYENALSFASKYMIEQFGSCTFVEIILITDGIQSYFDDTLNDEKSDDKLAYALNGFPNRIDVICLSDIPCYSHEYLRRLVHLNQNVGILYETKNFEMNYLKNEIIQKLIENVYEPQVFDLKCGHLASKIILSPKSRVFKRIKDNTCIESEISRKIEIYGFVSINDFQTPSFISQHTIYPTQSELDNEVGSFVALLYSGLKSEQTVALVKLADDWYGCVHCWSESKNELKKKSNLILTIFQPGNHSIDEICAKLVCKPHTNDDSQAQSFMPSELVRQQDEIKSYAKNCISWLKSLDLQNDIQKIMRYVKKIPEKNQIFFKELNRVRRAALSFGFYEVLEALAKMLERERTNLSSQEAISQLNHAICALRSPIYKEFKNDISPLHKL